MAYLNMFANDENTLGGINPNTVVSVGTGGGRVLTIDGGAGDSTLNFGNEADTIILAALASGSATVRQDGSNIVISDGNGNDYTMSLTSVADTLTFTNGNLAVYLDGSNVKISNGSAIQTLTNGGAATALTVTPSGGGSDTVTLTVDPDTKTANIFEAPLVTTFGQVRETLNSTDVLTGTGDNPTLNAVLNGTQVTVTPTMTGVSTLNLQALDASTLNLRNTTGELNVNNTNSTAGLTVRNIDLVNGTNGTALSVVNDNANATTFTFTDDSISGSSDAVALSLSSSTGVVTLADETGSSRIETLNITSSGDTGTNYNGNRASNFGASTINVTGDARLDLGANNTGTGITSTTIAAGGFTNNLWATLGAANTTITGGSGNDRFNFLGNLNTNDTIDGGTGTDTVQADVTANNLSGLKLTSVEVLSLIDTAATTPTVDMTGVSGVNTLEGAAFTDSYNAGTAAAAGGVITINNAGNAITTLAYHGAGTAGAANTGNGFSFNGTNFTGLGDTLNIVVDNVSKVTGSHAAGNYTIGNLNFSSDYATTTKGGVEYISLSGADGNVALGTINDATLVTLTAAVAGNLGITALNAGQSRGNTTNTLASVDFSGVTGTIDNGAGGTLSIDGLTNNATVKLGSGGSNVTLAVTGATSTQNFTVTGGAGADTIVGDTVAKNTIDGGDGNDTITGGANGNTLSGGTGVDTITGGAGIDIIDGGAGNDILGGAAGKDTITGGTGDDAITGGTGADTLTGGAGVDNFVQALGDSVASTADTLTAGGILATETITFGNGLDIVTDFNAGTGGDTLDVAAGAGAIPTALLGASTTMVAGTDYYLSGNYVGGVFTVTANGAGNDTLILQGTATTVGASTNAILLENVNSGNLAATNFI